MAPRERRTPLHRRRSRRHDAAAPDTCASTVSTEEQDLSTHHPLALAVVVAAALLPGLCAAQPTIKAPAIPSGLPAAAGQAAAQGAGAAGQAAGKVLGGGSAHTANAAANVEVTALDEAKKTITVKLDEKQSLTLGFGKAVVAGKLAKGAKIDVTHDGKEAQAISVR